MLLERVEFTNYADNRADIQEQNYLNAIKLFGEGKYEEALSIFITLEGYTRVLETELDKIAMAYFR